MSRGLREPGRCGFAIALRRWRLRPAAPLAAACLSLACGARAQDAPDLSNFSIEALGEIHVSSVSKRLESVQTAASSIYVISRDDVERAGARTIPEMLRLAPNLFVAQTTASRHTATARGFSGNPDAQNFSNKLLVLIDGRSVYSPLYSGVYWDAQDVVPHDLDRIEVISGPGATLWGANAVNGVVNVTTRNAFETQGGLVEAGAGDRERSATLRYGGLLGDRAAFRIYARGLGAEPLETRSGASAQDDWSRAQAGFRLDWIATAADRVTLQGDAYRGWEDFVAGAEETSEGQNVLARWTRSFSGDSTFQAQAYYDYSRRTTKPAGGYFVLHTYDVAGGADHRLQRRRSRGGRRRHPPAGQALSDRQPRGGVEFGARGRLGRGGGPMTSACRYGSWRKRRRFGSTRPARPVLFVALTSLQPSTRYGGPRRRSLQEYARIGGAVALKAS